MAARAVNITDRLHEPSGAGLHRVHFGQREPLRVRGQWRPHFDEGCQSYHLFVVAVFLVQQFQAALKVFSTGLGTFNRFGANRESLWQVRRVLLNLWKQPFLSGFAILGAAKTSDKRNESLVAHDVIVGGDGFRLRKLDNQGRKVCARNVGIEGNRIARKLGNTFYHWQRGFVLRVAFPQHSAFALGFGTMKGHLLATSFGLSAWVRNVSALRTLQSYTLEADA